jgi:hypothetical protein
MRNTAHLRHEWGVGTRWRGQVCASFRTGDRDAVAPRVDSRIIVEATQDRGWFTISGLLTESVLYSGCAEQWSPQSVSRPCTLAGSVADGDTAAGLPAARAPPSSSHRSSGADCSLTPQRSPPSLDAGPPEPRRRAYVLRGRISLDPKGSGGHDRQAALSTP